MIDSATSQPRWLNGWRIAGWGAALGLLALPALAMQFTDDVRWTPLDFGFAFLLLIALGTGLELAGRFGGAGPKGWGMAIASVAGFLTVWVNAAVGFIGDEGEMVNAGFMLLVAVGALLSLAVSFRAGVMRWIMGAIAVGQPILGTATLWMIPGHAVEWGIIAMFAGIWGSAAFCFHRTHSKR